MCHLENGGHFISVSMMIRNIIALTKKYTCDMRQTFIDYEPHSARLKYSKQATLSRKC